MNNLGQDVVAWLWVVKAIIIVGFFAMLCWDLHKLFNAEKRRSLAFIFLGAKAVIFILVVLALFMFFGAGNQVEVTLVEEDGHRQIVEARKVPPESTIKEEAKENDDEYLKKMDEGPEAARKQSEEYLKKVLERNERKKNK